MVHRHFRLSLVVVLGVCSLLFAQPREVGNLVIDGIPDIPQRIIDRMNQYQNVRSAAFLGWNPNGPGILILTRFAETSQIHYVEHPGGARQQLTFFKEPVAGGIYYPGPDRRGFLFSMDVGGAEFFQIFYFDLQTGQWTLLTDGKSRNLGGLWSHDGKWIAYSSTLRNGRDTDVRVMSLDKPGTSDLLTELPGSWSALDWSPDNSKLLIEHSVSANESHLYWCETATKKLTPINPQKDKKIAYGAASWSKDGRGVYYTSDETGEFRQLTYYELMTGKKTVITSNIPWDVDDFALSDDGKKLAYVTNEDGISKLRVLDLRTNREMNLPPLPVGLIFGLEFSKDSNALGLTMNTPQTSGDVYSINLTTRELVRWTFSEVGGLKVDQFVTPQLIHYPTFDQVNNKPRMIPAFYYKPRNASGRLPVIVSIHGGPESQERPGFNAGYQYLVNELGIAILAPNVRGSAGYGKTYLTLDNGYRREDSVKDIGALLDWIAQQPELDAGRIGVMGGSYGGYMVLSTMFNYNDRIRAGVDVVGISNFVTFLESTQEYRRDLRRVEYGDERDVKMREFLNQISPTTNAYRITKPLFVIQGFNDPRVPVTESEQIVKTVRNNRGQVWYLVAKDEGHGFRKKANRDYQSYATSLFWETFLLDGKPGMN
ncbi:MAG: prolyl oligopeptidase family serine peptidase [candidate division KSB1 bacterium]|nr:prolyl oligopeptidase family serine peptidase [candidate division KSB1 bacterium]MDZ7301064.1 prolyl oligopeptidase family serine peptidase [candidate division KSB1 bacterium]MDZ7312112.1 prolyl oligopeptidase family serine peptidase [candidate division KSB1 bacterium]